MDLQRINKNKFFEYMFIDSGIIIGFLGKELHLMTTIEELKVDTVRNGLISIKVISFPAGLCIKGNQGLAFITN